MLANKESSNNLKRKFDNLMVDYNFNGIIDTSNYSNETNVIKKQDNNSSDSDSESDSDSSNKSYQNDLHQSESYKNNVTIVAIKFFKDLVVKYDGLESLELLDVLKNKLNIMKRIYLKNRSKNNIFYKRVQSELTYYDTLLNYLKQDYENDPEKFNAYSYLDIFENDFLANQEVNNPTNMIFTILFNDNKTGNKPGNKPGNKQQISNDDEQLVSQFKKLYSSDSTNCCSFEYFLSLDKDQKQNIITKFTEIKENDKDIYVPNMMKVINWSTSNYNKSLILSKISQFENLQGSSEYYKLKTWINKIMKVPFGEYITPVVSKSSKPLEIKNYLHTVRSEFDQNIYGHSATKDQLIKIIAQSITNPEEGGNVFALEGPPGVGKTAIIHDGIAKALNRPFAFISLGGATDASFLEGFDYTYEGSNHGRIIDVLIQTKCMNPIIYFDELDKVSDTPKGEEIINILMHLTDTTQNFHYNDKYFGGINFDLSKVIMIFSFNDASRVSRILKDRMKIIKVKGYKLEDKVTITTDYVLPKLIKSIGLDDSKVKFYKEIIEFIIDNYTNEGGVRKLKEVLNDILLEINLRKLESFTNEDAIVITKDLIEKDILKKKRKIEHLLISKEPKVGVVNGLWANSYGVGGLIPIECSWVPSQTKLNLELTGMQGTVMKESMMVARTVSWKILPKNIKEKVNKQWKKSFEHGIHIHCPDGATPKDGPSAGGAITTCLISLLTGIQVDNKIAMTGEINLKGQITAIGGLEEKLFGAKKAGAKLVLCPKENSKDLTEIREKYKTLFDDGFKVEMVDNIWTILEKVLVKKINFVRF